MLIDITIIHDTLPRCKHASGTRSVYQLCCFCSEIAGLGISWHGPLVNTRFAILILGFILYSLTVHWQSGFVAHYHTIRSPLVLLFPFIDASVEVRQTLSNHFTALCTRCPQQRLLPLGVRTSRSSHFSPDYPPRFAASYGQWPPKTKPSISRT